jgi:hypothetical protein
MSEFKSVIMVGSIASGVSTAAEHLRGPAYIRNVLVPLCFTTQPHRPNVDNTLERLYMDRETMEEGIALKTIFPHYQGDSDIGRKPHLFGFVPPPDDDERVVIYPGTNYMLTDSNESLTTVKKESLIVVVNASIEVRRLRLIKRLGSVRLADELLARSSKSDDTIRLGAQPMITIDTSFSPDPHHGQRQMSRILEEEFSILPESGVEFGTNDGDDSGSSTS